MISSHLFQPAWVGRVAVGVLLVLVTACGGDAEGTPIGLSPIKSVAISASTATIKVGLTTQFTASVTPLTSSASTAVVWSSSDQAVASVASSGTGGTIGTVTGNAVGTATITARAVADPAQLATAVVTVEPATTGCSVTGAIPFTFGAQINNTLTTADCTVNGRPAKLYRFTVPGTTTVQIGVASNFFDAFGILFDAGGTQIATDDNSDGRLNYARIVRVLGGGTYNVAVTSASTDTVRLGLFQLNIGLPIPSCTINNAVGTLAAGQSVSGSLVTSDCIVGDGSFGKMYRITVNATTSFQLDLSSGSFDPLMTLVDVGGSVLASDDNGGGGTSARISRTLGPGTYYVTATSAIPASTGTFTLTAR
jgi:hypothetical protein